MKGVRVLAALALIAGAALVGRAAYMAAKAELAKALIRRSWEESVRTGGTHRPWRWADTYPVARLRIPRIGYDEFVLEGASPRTLAFGPARLDSGARFGEVGNVAVAGHRTSWFKPLQRVEVGDSVQVQWFGRRGGLHSRTYAISEIDVVQPDDVRMALADDELTLITCFPFGSSPYSPQRFVVRAVPAGSHRMKAAGARSIGAAPRNLQSD